MKWIFKININYQILLLLPVFIFDRKKIWYENTEIFHSDVIKLSTKNQIFFHMTKTMNF